MPHVEHSMVLHYIALHQDDTFEDETFRKHHCTAAILVLTLEIGAETSLQQQVLKLLQSIHMDWILKANIYLFYLEV